MVTDADTCGIRRFNQSDRFTQRLRQRDAMRMNQHAPAQAVIQPLRVPAIAIPGANLRVASVIAKRGIAAVCLAPWVDILLYAPVQVIVLKGAAAQGNTVAWRAFFRRREGVTGTCGAEPFVQRDAHAQAEQIVLVIETLVILFCHVQIVIVIQAIADPVPAVAIAQRGGGRAFLARVVVLADQHGGEIAEVFSQVLV